MLRFKLGALFGFALGWAVGSGRANQFLEQLRAPADRPCGRIGLRCLAGPNGLIRMADEPDCVRLAIPLDTRYVRIVRLVARGVATTMGFDVEGVDDLRIAVEELCAALFDVSEGPALELAFEMHDGRVDVQGRTVAMPTATLDSERFALSEQILSVACDGYSLKVDSGIAYFSLSKRV